MKNISRSIIAIILALFCTYNVALSEQGKQYIIDDFKAAKQQGSEVFSHGRTWYTFGGFKINAAKNGIHASGNSEEWRGFGVDPGARGKRGVPITTNGFKTIVVDIKGSASAIKLELYDEEYVKYDLWFDLASISQGAHQQGLPPELCGKNIAKLQFVCAPGEVDIEINSISLQ